MKISFIGAGNLPEAIIDALIKKLNLKGGDIAIYDKNQAQYERYGCGYEGLIKANTIKEAIDHGRVIFLAIKPQNFSEALGWISDLNIDLEEKIFVSVAAGISIEYIQEQLLRNSESGSELNKIAIVRTMPNTSVMIGEGMTAMCRNKFVADGDFAEIRSIFDSMGKTLLLDEEKMNKIISVNGSSPAYVYLLAEAMTEGAIAQGFAREEVYDAVIQSLCGAAMMLKTSGKQAEELLKKVASPNGTTERALQSLNDNNFTETIKKAMSVCTERADELTRTYAK